MMFITEHIEQCAVNPITTAWLWEICIVPDVRFWDLGEAKVVLGEN
jgi:hypothetical protein